MNLLEYLLQVENLNGTVIGTNRATAVSFFFSFFFVFSFFLKLLEDISPFRWVTVLDFWWCLPCQGGSFLRAFSLVWSSDSPLVKHLLTVEVNMAAKPFPPTYLQTCPQALVEFQARARTYGCIYCCLWYEVFFDCVFSYQVQLLIANIFSGK